MLNNPLIQTLALFFGSYMAMKALKNHPPIGSVITAAAGVLIVIIWMLRYQRGQLATVYKNPIAKPVIDLVCSLVKEQPPVDGSVSSSVSQTARSAGPTAPVAAQRRSPVSAGTYEQESGAASTEPASTLVISSAADPRPIIDLIKQAIRNNDETIEKLVAQIQQNLRLRERSALGAKLPPAGMFLFWGKSGLGKHSLASETGRCIYPGDSVGTLDFADRGASLESLVSSAFANPKQTFIIENLDSANQQDQDELLSILKSGSAIEHSSGKFVSFRNCFFFILVHKQTQDMPRAITVSSGQGFTQVVERLNTDVQVDEMLGLLMHGIFTFQLPREDVEIASVIALIMQRECRKYQLELASIDPAVLSREVEEAAKMGSFKAVPARVARIMSKPIAAAVQRQQPFVKVLADMEQRSWSEAT